MKKATHGQIKDVAVRVLNLNPEVDNVDGDAIQKGTEGYSNEEIKSRIIAFLNNRLCLITKGPSALLVDRTKPFNPAEFIGKGWTIEAEDAKSLKLAEIDFAKVLFTACLKDGETVITGEEKLVRHIAAKHIRLDAKIGQCLFEEKDQVTLEWLHKTFGITWFELPGTILRRAGDRRYFLYLYRGGASRWDWSYDWLGDARPATVPSAVLAS
jgi:hypothetical protein